MDQETCPKCGAQLSAISETRTGRKLRRCSKGSWNTESKKVEGCDYVLWLPVEPINLNEDCPKCGAPLVLQVTRFGKKMKKCSNGGWDKDAKKPTGCDYVEWINGTSENLEEKCPKCQANLILYTTATGKKMKKCSSGGWDKDAKKPTGCDYVLWLKPGQSESETGEEYLPPEPPEDLPF